MVVIQGVVAIPGGMVRGDPGAVESGRDFAGAAGGGDDVLRRIVELFDQRIADLDERFRPEVLPPVAMGAVELLQFRHRHASGAGLRGREMVRIVEVAQHGSDQVNLALPACI